MAEPIRWGIIGLGRIAARFAGSLMAAPDARIAAVLSRDQKKADAFAAACGAKGFSDAGGFLNPASISSTLHRPTHCIANRQSAVLKPARRC